MGMHCFACITTNVCLHHHRSSVNGDRRWLDRWRVGLPSRLHSGVCSLDGTHDTPFSSIQSPGPSTSKACLSTSRGVSSVCRTARSQNARGEFDALMGSNRRTVWVGVARLCHRRPVSLTYNQDDAGVGYPCRLVLPIPRFASYFPSFVLACASCTLHLQ